MYKYNHNLLYLSSDGRSKCVATENTRDEKFYNAVMLCSMWFQMEDPEVLQQNYNSVLATLALVGGVDERPRLGGLVQHTDWGLCTVARIAINGKITVQPHDFGPRKICRLHELEVVRNISKLRFCCQILLLFFTHIIYEVSQYC